MSMKNQFIFIRGRPATGKITVARIIEKELGWKVFWLHELKNTIVDIVKEHRIPRLIDNLTDSILRFIMDRGDNVIFVRPSPDKETVEAIIGLVAAYDNYVIKYLDCRLRMIACSRGQPTETTNTGFERNKSSIPICMNAKRRQSRANT